MVPPFIPVGSEPLLAVPALPGQVGQEAPPGPQPGAPAALPPAPLLAGEQAGLLIGPPRDSSLGCLALLASHHPTSGPQCRECGGLSKLHAWAQSSETKPDRSVSSNTESDCAENRVQGGYDRAGWPWGNRAPPAPLGGPFPERLCWLERAARLPGGQGRLPGRGDVKAKTKDEVTAAATV